MGAARWWWALALLGLAACSNQPVNYRDIQLLPPLQVPPGLQPPRTNAQMAIPGLSLSDVEAVRRRLAVDGAAADIEKPPSLSATRKD